MSHCHQCTRCGHRWWHADDLGGDKAAHTCARCGSFQFWKVDAPLWVKRKETERIFGPMPDELVRRLRAWVHALTTLPEGETVSGYAYDLTNGTFFRRTEKATFSVEPVRGDDTMREVFAEWDRRVARELPRLIQVAPNLLDDDT